MTSIHHNPIAIILGSEMNSQETHQDPMLDIAIIGMACRVPGAKNIDEFWHNLRNGVESIKFFADTELQNAGVDPTVLEKPNYVKASPILEDIENFDAAFFGFSPHEAEVIDPQNRLFLESAWEALENAGYNPQTYKGLIGVYGGSAINRYLLNNLIRIPNLENPYGFSSEQDFLTTNVSYKLNLKGPSLNVQTFCSTSLVATHLAVQSLLNQECDIALAGGVTIHVPHQAGYMYHAGDILSPDGHCRTFDAKAQGTVFGSGVGIVVLKRLEDAITDGDHIEAVIKGSAVNNDGSLKVSFTSPSVNGQIDVVMGALDVAGISAETISYIEAHGTATEMGDPIEVAALTQAFRRYTNKRGFCAIGAVKTNFGHLMAASGVSGLIKTVLSLKHKQIPATLHFEKPNPKIDFANSPFYVNSQLSEWKSNGLPRRAGVSSLGFGGTNAHVIVEEAPELEPSSASRPYQLLLLSAKTNTALETATQNLANHFKQHPELSLADVAYTLQVGRQAFDHRRMLVCNSLTEAVSILENKDFIYSQHQEFQNRGVNFLFTGEGSQYVKMAEGLYQREPVFREQLDSCCQILLPLIGLDLRDILYPSENDIDEMGARLQETAIAQPAIFAIACAIAQLWIGWGIKPKAMIGDGLGEYVAACIAGVFSLEDALRLVAVRDKSEQSFRAELQQIKLGKPKIPYISNVSGDWITAAQATDPQYWVQHLRQPVGFADGLQVLLQDTESVLLEVGVGKTLSSLDVRHQNIVLSSLRNPQEQKADLEVLLKALGQLWLAGVAIDWDAFYEDERRYRVPLPTYPFERQRFWLEPSSVPAQIVQEQPVKSLASKSSDIADWFYVPCWQQTLPHLAAAPQAEIQSDCWLVFIDTLGFGESLVQKLKQQNHCVITVAIADRFDKLAQDRYVLNLEQSDSYIDLIASLKESGDIPQKILHLWSLSIDNRKLCGDAFRQAQSYGLYSLIFLAQALDKLQIIDHIQIRVISNNLQSVTGEERLCPEKATLLAPCKVISQEYPHLICQSIDVVLPELDSLPSARLVEQCLTEITSQNTDAAIAYRGNHRWNQSFEAIRLEPTPKQIPLRQKGTYLITGGLGKIGLTLAEYLARSQAKLILIGRSGLPTREDWSQWLTTHDLADAISQKIRKIAQLESMGAEILIVRADVTNREQMQVAIAESEAKLGSINGVIHAAGFLGQEAFGEIAKLSTVDCENHFQSKVYGLLVLDDLLQGRKLDFGILMSSLSSILGGLGFVAYAAVNQFMDSFAHSHRHIPWKSLNWDTWQLELEQDDASANSSLIKFSMTAEEGLEAFERILSKVITQPIPQIVISTADLQMRIKQWIRQNPLDIPDAQASQKDSIKEAKTTRYARPNLANTYIAPRDDLEKTICTIWQELFSLDRVGMDDNFFHLGGDSFLLVQARSKLQSVLNQPISNVDLFEYSTIGSLAAYLRQENKAQPVAPQIEDRASKQRAAMEERASELINRRQQDRED
jgi:acyl transferase domain-containing protein